MKNIIIDFNCNYIRTALVEDRKLIEVLIDEHDNESLVGNIYSARVENILQGQFAFINIGYKKNAFLQLDDIRQSNLYINENGTKKLNIKNGNQILVQCLKDSKGLKGPLVTSELSFTGRYIVLLKNNFNQITISRKIEDTVERKRLKTIISNIISKEYSVIIRTEATNIDEETLKSEFLNLKNLCEDILSKGVYLKPPAVIYKENKIYEKSLKLLLKDDIDNIIINSPDEKNYILDILKNYNLHEDILKIYDGDLNIFEEYELETQIEKALHNKVWLKSGGFLIIEQTEAFIVIDVNTGKFTDKKGKNNIILKTNIEAGKEIVRQIRLRNLSGMIIIDFINMNSEEDKEKFLFEFKNFIKEDRIGINIVGMTELGLMQLTRKKVRPEISRYFLKNCNCCNGAGKIYNEKFVVDKIFNNIYKTARQSIFNKFIVTADKNIYNFLLERKNKFDDLELKFNIKIYFKKIENSIDSIYKIEKEKV